MISDLVYITQDLYTSNQVRFRFMYLLLSLGITGLHTRGLCHLINALTSIFNKVDIHIKKKF